MLNTKGCSVVISDLVDERNIWKNMMVTYEDRQMLGIEIVDYLNNFQFIHSTSMLIHGCILNGFFEFIFSSYPSITTIQPEGNNSYLLILQKFSTNDILLINQNSRYF